MSLAPLRFAACLLLCAAAACGPVGATNVIDDAEIALARAHAADGEKLAIYETTRADLFLIKAREEQGHARYSDAMDLAAEALKSAEAAVRKAGERRQSGAPPAAPTVRVETKTAAPPPGTVAPGTAAPGTAAPGTAWSGTAAAGTAGAGTAAPGTAAPGTAAPGTDAPGTVGPGTAAPGTVAPAKPVPATSVPAPASTPPAPTPAPTPAPVKPSGGNQP